MNKDKNGSGLQAGFTLVEIVVVIGIIAIIFGIVLASISAAKDKSADAETKKVISEVALNAEGKEIAPGVVDYQSAFDSVGASEKLNDLAAKYNVDPSAFQFFVSAKTYAIVFPLKKGTYYCIDSAGHGTGMEIPSLFPDRGSHNCLLAAGYAGAGGGVSGGVGFPTISLPTTVESCTDRGYCSSVYSEGSISSVDGSGGGILNPGGEQLPGGGGFVQQDLGAQVWEGFKDLFGGGGSKVEEPADQGSTTIPVGISVAINNGGFGSGQLSDYLASSITASDGEDGDLTNSISIESVDATYINSIPSNGLKGGHAFSGTSTMFPHGGGGDFAQCGSPYAFKYSVTDSEGHTTSAIQEYMTCASVVFRNFDPSQGGGGGAEDLPEGPVFVPQLPNVKE